MERWTQVTQHPQLDVALDRRRVAHGLSTRGVDWLKEAKMRMTVNLSGTRQWCWFTFILLNSIAGCGLVHVWYCTVGYHTRVITQESHKLKNYM